MLSRDLEHEHVNFLQLKNLSIDTMQLFLDSNDFNSELLKLKQRIKNILNECFIDILTVSLQDF